MACNDVCSQTVDVAHQVKGGNELKNVVENDLKPIVFGLANVFFLLVFLFLFVLLVCNFLQFLFPIIYLLIEIDLNGIGHFLYLLGLYYVFDTCFKS